MVLGVVDEAKGGERLNPVRKGGFTVREQAHSVFYGGSFVLRRSLMFVTAATYICYGGVSICIPASIFVQTGRHRHGATKPLTAFGTGRFG